MRVLTLNTVPQRTPGTARPQVLLAIAAVQRINTSPAKRGR